MTPSSRTPAVCTTAVSGCSAGTARPAAAASASRSATSQAATVTVGAEPGQLGAQLRGARRGRAAAADEQQVPDAVRARRGGGRTGRRGAPVPPVIRTVPPGFHGPAAARPGRRLGGAVRARRGTSRARRGPPTAARPEATTAAAAPPPRPGRPSRSTRTNRPGFSVCADRTRPHTAAPAEIGDVRAARHRAPGHHHQPGVGGPVVGGQPAGERQRPPGGRRVRAWPVVTVPRDTTGGEQRRRTRPASPGPRRRRRTAGPGRARGRRCRCPAPPRRPRRRAADSASGCQPSPNRES